MRNIHITKSGVQLKLMAIALVIFLVSGCKDDFTSPATPSGSTIATVIAAENNYSILTAALAKTNQTGSLNNNTSGLFTLFAPTDSAFLVYFQTKLSKPA